jgi:glycosyltransferase involved in cell wall biosynthesis
MTVSGRRPQLLWVSAEIPDAELGGGSIRQYHLLRRISRRADIDLVLVGELRDQSILNYVRQATTIGRPPSHGAIEGPLSTARRRALNLSSLIPGSRPSEVVLNNKVVDALRSRLPATNRYELVQVEHEELAGLIPRRRSGRWAITLHNLISVRCRHRAALTDKERVRWVYKADAGRAERWEHRIKSLFDVTITVSDSDAQAIGGGAVVIPNGVDLEKFVPGPLPRAPRLLFSASFNYEPNEDAAVWLCRELLPLVRAKVPDATLLLVGREPGPRIRELQKLDGVEAHFDVESVVPYLQSARVSLAPLRQGSGTRLKVLEAMAAARPVAGTKIGVEGLPLEHERSAVIADDPDHLAAGIARLCTDDSFASRIASRGRKVAEEGFSWDRIADSYLEQVLFCRTASKAAHRTPTA